MQRPARLTGVFVRGVVEPGRYGDGRGGYGLALVVTPRMGGGVSKAWVQRVRVDGRPTNLGLGGYPLVTLAEAREAAYRNARAIRSGSDPLADRRRRAAVPTFAEAADAVVTLYEASWKDGARTAALWRQRLNDYALPRLGRMRVDAITSADVLACVLPIWATRRETAQKTLQYVTAVLAWAVAQGHAPANVAKGDAITSALPRATAAKAQHLRALDWRDLPAAFDAIEADGVTTATLALRFLALTATRAGEVRGMTWAEVDGATWELPAGRTKMGRPHRVALSAQALAVLDRAREYADGFGLVFSTPTGKAIASATPSKLFRDHGIATTAHGLRSSFRTWAAECGHDRQLAEFALGHVEGSEAERAYLRGDLFERRAGLMAAWGAVCVGRRQA